MSLTAARVTQPDVARCIRPGGAPKRGCSMLGGELNYRIVKNAEQVLG
jgi:hypothetical protein